MNLLNIMKFIIRRDLEQRKYIKNAKNNGLTEKEFVEIVTKLAFYTGGLMLGQRLKWEKNFIRKNVIIAC